MQIIAGRLLLGRGDTVATCLSMATAHARTLSGWPALLSAGCRHIAMVDPDPRAAADILSRHRPTLLETYPNVFIHWEQLADDPREPLRDVRTFVSTFDAAHPRTIQRLLSASRRRFPIYLQAYAQSEVGGATLSIRRRRRQPRTDARDVGWAVPRLSRVRIVDPATGSRQRRGQAGLIEVAAVGQFAGYVGEQDRTNRQYDEAWWNMGDLGLITWRGSLRLLGRQVDAIPGLQDPLALEDLLLERLPELTELVLIAGQDDVPTAVACVRGDGVLDPARWTAATAGLARMRGPVVYRWADMPTTATWKVRRHELARLLQNTCSANSPCGPVRTPALSPQASPSARTPTGP